MQIINATDMVSRQTTQKLKDILDLASGDDLMSDTRFNTAIADANSAAAAFVRAQYPDFPFTIIPPVLKRHTCILCLWYLLDYKEANKSEKDTLQYQDTVEFFKNLKEAYFDLEYLSKVETNEKLPATNVDFVRSATGNFNRAIEALD
jgi:phage gp36-like protein